MFLRPEKVCAGVLFMNRDIVVIGASAGGVECLTELMRALPADFPAAIFVVLHVSPHSVSVLPHILQRAGQLPALHAQDGDPILRGRVYVAPPDHHLLLQEHCIRVIRGPRENGHRPAVDPLFRTAAHYYGPRVIGVVLSGALDDGTAGLAAIQARGGVSLVQDPQEALHPGMPGSAVRNGVADWVLPLAEIAPVLMHLVAQPIEPEETLATEAMEMETTIVEFDESTTQHDHRPGTPSSYTCPECHGCLYELRDGELVRFRCRVGHAFSPDSLLAEQAQSLEAALWIALRALEESSSLSRRIAERASSREQSLPAARFNERADEADKHAAVLREVLLGNRNIAGPIGDMDKEMGGDRAAGTHVNGIAESDGIAGRDGIMDSNGAPAGELGVQIEPAHSGNS